MLYEDNDYLIHFGIKGQRWGVRRFQNLDGTLTQEGKERYSKQEKEMAYKNECKQKAIDNTKKDRDHWKSMVDTHKAALEDLTTDKRKGDWYNTDEEKKRLVNYTKSELSLAQKHLKDWNKALKQLEEMPVEDMPAKVVKERTNRNYIINSMLNNEDINEGYHLIDKNTVSKLVRDLNSSYRESIRDIEDLPAKIKEYESRRNKKEVIKQSNKQHYDLVLKYMKQSLESSKKGIKFDTELKQYFKQNDRITPAGLTEMISNLCKKHGMDYDWVMKYYSENFPNVFK